MIDEGRAQVIINNLNHKRKDMAMVIMHLLEEFDFV
jgi:hypothetical protein